MLIRTFRNITLNATIWKEKNNNNKMIYFYSASLPHILRSEDILFFTIFLIAGIMVFQF